MRKIALILPLLALTACVTPQVLTGNNKSVTVDNTTRMNIKESQQVADQHCTQYKRSAVPTIYGNGHTVYECR